MDRPRPNMDKQVRKSNISEKVDHCRRTPSERFNNKRFYAK